MIRVCEARLWVLRLPVECLGTGVWVASRLCTPDLDSIQSGQPNLNLIIFDLIFQFDLFFFRFFFCLIWFSSHVQSVSGARPRAIAARLRVFTTPRP